MASENTNIIRRILMQGIETLPLEKLTDPGFQRCVVLARIEIKGHRDKAMDQWREAEAELQELNRRFQQDQGNQGLLQETLRALIKSKTYETLVEKLSHGLAVLGGLIDFWSDDNDNTNNNGDDDDNQGDALAV